MAGIFDEGHAIFSAQGAYLGEIAGLAREMHGDQGFRLTSAALNRCSFSRSAVTQRLPVAESTSTKSTWAPQ